MARPAGNVFMCHTHLDKDTCDKFDRASARVGIKVFRSEDEIIVPPAWKSIKDKIQRSMALFLLVGPELVKAQSAPHESWEFTQNWMSYEVGLACAMKKDVWVICDNATINFPVPYLNNYGPYGIDVEAQGFIASVLTEYLNFRTFRLGWRNRKIKCGNQVKGKECGVEFNLHARIDRGSSIVCPACLQTLLFRDGWYPQ